MKKILFICLWSLLWCSENEMSMLSEEEEAYEEEVSDLELGDDAFVSSDDEEQKERLRKLMDDNNQEEKKYFHFQSKQKLKKSSLLESSDEEEDSKSPVQVKSKPSSLTEKRDWQKNFSPGDYGFDDDTLAGIMVSSAMDPSYNIHE